MEQGGLLVEAIYVSIIIAVLPWVQRWESELFSLLDPVQRQAASQSLQAEIRRLPTVENGFHYVGSEKGTLKNPAHIPFVEAKSSGDRSLTGNFSGHDPFVPLVRSGQGFH